MAIIPEILHSYDIFMHDFLQSHFRADEFFSVPNCVPSRGQYSCCHKPLDVDFRDYLVFYSTIYYFIPVLTRERARHFSALSLSLIVPQGLSFLIVASIRKFKLHPNSITPTFSNVCNHEVNLAIFSPTPESRFSIKWQMADGR